MFLSLKYCLYIIVKIFITSKKSSLELCFCAEKEVYFETNRTIKNVWKNKQFKRTTKNLNEIMAIYNKIPKNNEDFVL